jgi:hypothetical protein
MVTIPAAPDVWVCTPASLFHQNVCLGSFRTAREHSERHTQTSGAEIKSVRTFCAARRQRTASHQRHIGPKAQPYHAGLVPFRGFPCRVLARTRLFFGLHYIPLAVHSAHKYPPPPPLNHLLSLVTAAGSFALKLHGS